MSSKLQVHCTFLAVSAPGTRTGHQQQHPWTMNLEQGTQSTETRLQTQLSEQALGGRRGQRIPTVVSVRYLLLALVGLLLGHEPETAQCVLLLHNRCSSIQSNELARRQTLFASQKDSGLLII